MLRLKDYQSAPIRKVTISPSRRAAMDVLLKKKAPPATSAASGQQATGGESQTPHGNNHSASNDAGAAKEVAAADRDASPTLSHCPPHQKPPNVNFSNLETVGGTHYALNSPRSLALCEEFGISPMELVPRPLSQFKVRGVTDRIAEMRFDHYETRRRSKLSMLAGERENRIRTAATRESYARDRSSLLSAQKQQPSQEDDEHGDSNPGTIAAPVINGNGKGDAQLSLFPRYTQEVINRVTKGTQNESTSSTSAGAPNNTSAVSSVQNQPSLSARSTSRQTAPRLLGSSVVDEEVQRIKLERAKALMEKENRRRLVYERSQRIREERQYDQMSRQVEDHRRSARHLEATRASNQEKWELQRLRREDTLNNIREQKKRDEYVEKARARSAFRRSDSASSAVSVSSINSTIGKRGNVTVGPVDATRDRFQVQLAKSMYMTPRQRTERARSASVGSRRSATPQAYM